VFPESKNRCSSRRPIGPDELRSAEARGSLASLAKLQAKIERIKSEHRQDRAEAAIALLDQIEADSPEELKRVLLRYQAGRELVRRT
jgi:hypothetical protein